MSSSGLIYAVIVGAWAAYLVPMWLRRQDELNEARPTERFSTAIRLLSGKAAMERRYAKEAGHGTSSGVRVGTDSAADGDDGQSVLDGRGADEDPDVGTEGAVDVRVFADPKTMVGGGSEVAEHDPAAPPHPEDGAAHDEDARTPRTAAAYGAEEPPPDGAKRSKTGRTKPERAPAERGKRARVLARRRRTTMLLFLAFTFGAIVAAVGGVAFLWAPAVPAGLLSAYIVHLRLQERRRFLVTMDHHKAQEAASRLRDRRAGSTAAEPATVGGSRVADSSAVEEARRDPEPTQTHAAVDGSAPAADRRALVERTDHAEWVDQQRGRVREQPEGEEWDPVPVPLPTYVSAPVAPRTARAVDLDAPDTWSSARSSTAGETGGFPVAEGPSGQRAAEVRAQGGPEAEQEAEAGEAREWGRTPLFDQYADEDRPRAVNE